MKILKLTGAGDTGYVRVNMDVISGYDWDKTHSCTRVYDGAGMETGWLVLETPNEIDDMLRRGDYIVGGDYHA